jgi:ATP-dependent helicase HrpB
MAMPEHLPIDDCLPDLREALAAGPAAVLEAPPGAGKTTRVPLALLDEPWLEGRRIVMLEPRRLAARTAARFMAATLGEKVGETVGFRVRFEARVSARARIEVVTEGILTRRLRGDPALDGVGLLIFDEFHERSLDADLALALARDAQQALRPDLKLLVMSATLDGGYLSKLLDDAPVVASAGRQYPVETRYIGPPRDGRLEPAVADAVGRALHEDRGSVLAFLPGEREIRRTADLLRDRVPDGVDVHPLYGAMPAKAQDAAIRAPRDGRRKVVLATTIAETSLTIDGIAVVVDSGFKRAPAFDPRRGMSRLRTVPVSRAAAEQRRGRAGRIGPGVCYRLWHQAEDRGRAEFDTPEMLQADLAPLALTLADWGAAGPDELPWIDAPPRAAWDQACDLLRRLEALDGAGRITALGRRMAALPLHPRLAHMVCRADDEGAAATACDLAALLSERDILQDRGDSDIASRLARLADAAAAGAHRGALDRVRQAAAQLRKAMAVDANVPADRARAGLLLAWAYPDRIAGRAGAAGRYRLSGGGAARLADDDGLAVHDWLVVADHDGADGDGRIRLAAALDRADLDAAAAGLIEVRDEVAWDAREEAVVARRQHRLGDLVIDEAPLPAPDPDALVAAMLAGVRRIGLAALPWTPALDNWRQRIAFLRRIQPEAGWPDLSDAWLDDHLEDWLAPHLAGLRRRRDLAGVDLAGALRALLTWDLAARLDEQAPESLPVPAGATRRIDYRGEGGPRLRLRLQEAFGMTATPTIAGGRQPVTMELLSPADRPLALTADLASFWRDVYPQVRAEMRGRYPKHDWPENPLTATPGRGPKRRRAPD